MGHVFNSSIISSKPAWSIKLRSRTARAVIQRNPVSKNENQPTGERQLLALGSDLSTDTVVHVLPLKQEFCYVAQAGSNSQ